jgi:DNA invertase Pin-like site-specific DNA recombinase
MLKEEATMPRPANALRERAQKSQEGSPGDHSPINGNGSPPRQAPSTRDDEVVALGYASARHCGPGDDVDLRRQAVAIQRFCASRGWQLVGLASDVRPLGRRGTGWPSLTYVLEQLRSNAANCLVVAELTCLSSSIAGLGEVLEAVEQAGARLVSLAPAIDTETQTGRAAVRVLTSVSRWERARRAKMTSAARAKVSSEAGIDPKLKRRVRRMRGAGMTLQAIADALNDEGVPTVRGGATWRPSSVQAALGYRRPPEHQRAAG